MQCLVSLNTVGFRIGHSYAGTDSEFLSKVMVNIHSSVQPLIISAYQYAILGEVVAAQKELCILIPAICRQLVICIRCGAENNILPVGVDGYILHLLLRKDRCACKVIPVFHPPPCIEHIKCSPHLLYPVI